MPPRKRRRRPETPAHVGRPTKLTPALQEAIVQAIKAGNYAEVAARHAGIDRATYFRWMQRGEEESGPFHDFCDAIRDAEAFAESRAVAIVANGMLADPKHAEWYLERKHPDRWGRHDRTEHRIEGGKKPVTFTMTLDRPGANDD